jgi:hypothetical protein
VGDPAEVLVFLLFLQSLLIFLCVKGFRYRFRTVYYIYNWGEMCRLLEEWQGISHLKGRGDCVCSSENKGRGQTTKTPRKHKITWRTWRFNFFILAGAPPGYEVSPHRGEGWEEC